MTRFYTDNITFDDGTSFLDTTGEIWLGQTGGNPTVSQLSADFDTSAGTKITDSTNIFYVDKGGNDSNDGKTLSRAKLTIGSAITAAGVGPAVILINPGTYVENISLTSSVSLIGMQSGVDDRIVQVTGGLTINLTGRACIENINFMPPSGVVGITMTGANVCTASITNCNFEMNNAVGINLTNDNMDLLCTHIRLVGAVGSNTITATGGCIAILHGELEGGDVIALSGTNEYSQLGGVINDVGFTLADTSVLSIFQGVVSSGADVAIDIGATAEVTLRGTAIFCNHVGGNAITGTGTLIWASVTLAGTATSIQAGLLPGTMSWHPFGSTSVVGVNSYNSDYFSANSATGEVTLAQYETDTGQTIGAVNDDVLTLDLGGTAGGYILEAEIIGFESSGPAIGWIKLVGGARTTGAASTVVGTTGKDIGCDTSLDGITAQYVASGNDIIVRVTGVVALTINWKVKLTYTFIS